MGVLRRGIPPYGGAPKAERPSRPDTRLRLRQWLSEFEGLTAQRRKQFKPWTGAPPTCLPLLH